MDSPESLATRSDRIASLLSIFIGLALLHHIPYDDAKIMFKVASEIMDTLCDKPHLADDEDAFVEYIKALINSQIGPR